MVCYFDCRHYHQRLLPAIHQLSEPERYGVSTCEPCYQFHTLIKKGEVKTASVFTRLSSSLVPSRSLNLLNGCGRENVFGVDCWDGCT